MSESEGIVRYSKFKPDDFLRAKYEHMMGGLTDSPCRLKGLAGRPPSDWPRKQFWELARAASPIRHTYAAVFAAFLALVE